MAPGITPYRFGFNNPVYWSDPSGLFETIAGTRAYMEGQGIDSDLYYISPDGNGGYNVHYKDMTIYDATADMLGGMLDTVTVSNGASSSNTSGFLRDYRI